MKIFIYLWGISDVFKIETAVLLRAQTLCHGGSSSRDSCVAFVLSWDVVTQPAVAVRMVVLS